MRNKSTLIIFVLNLVIVTYWLVNQQYFPVHDFTAGARIFELTQGFKDGHFPPRWSKNFGFGLGMPLFQFYAPLAFYFASVFNLLGISILSSLKLVYLTSTILGFIGAYLLGKKIINHYGGLITATAFTLAPYHALNLYVRGATAEYVALSFTPFSLYFTFQLIDKQFSKKNYLGLVFSLVGIYLSHNITILTFMPFWFLIVLSYALIKNKFKKIIISFLAQLHSLAISAYFIIPAFFQRSQTSTETLIQGFSQYSLHFLYFKQLINPKWGYGGSILGIDDQMSFYLGLDLLLLTIFSIGYLIKTKNKIIKLYLLFAFTFLTSIFASNFKSNFLWKIIPLASYIQFPWRFLGVSSLALSLLAGFSMLNKTLKKHWFVILSLIIILNGGFFRPEKLIDPTELYNHDSSYIKNRMSKVMPDYLPSGVNWQNMSVPKKLIETQNIDTIIDLQENNTNSIKAKIIANQNDIITINRYYFPNWKLTINGLKDACHKNFDSRYSCSVKAGVSDFQLNWNEQGINLYSDFITIISLVALGIYAISRKSTHPSTD